MNWFQKISQIAATNLSSQLWYHGTDTTTAYGLMKNMFARPRSETGVTSYEGSFSSVPTSVYLTALPGKAAKHAIEVAEARRSHPVILVIQPENLGYVQVDEDMVHMILNENSHFDNDWYPSPRLEQEIFSLAAESLRLDDFERNKSNKLLVLEYLQEKHERWGGDDDIDDYLQEEGIVPNSGGFYEYDESMHLAKEISRVLNNEHQKEAIINFGNMAHDGKVQVSEIYLIPWEIEREHGYMESPTSLGSYEELQQFGTRINPQQLLMSFMANNVGLS